MVDLSIIIPSYNTKELLKKCLESVFSDHRFEIEVIVVDNNSQDGSPQMVKKEFPEVILIENKDNLGFAKAANQGLKRATGEYLFLLNSDTVLEKNTLEKLLEYGKTIPPAIVGPRLLNPDGTIQPSVFMLPTVKRAIAEYWFGKKGYFSKYTPSGDVAVEVESVVGGAMFFPQEVVEKIGYLDERYFMYFEDLDYCRRAKKFGLKVYYFPGAEVFHEHGASGKSLARGEDQWKRLIPSSKIYHGVLKYHLVSFIIKLGQRFGKR